MTRSEQSPAYHTERVKREMNALIDHLREDVTKVDEPQFKAPFETSAEVINGLVTAISHYEAKNEAAWRD